MYIWNWLGTPRTRDLRYRQPLLNFKDQMESKFLLSNFPTILLHKISVQSNSEFKPQTLNGTAHVQMVAWPFFVPALLRGCSIYPDFRWKGLVHEHADEGGMVCKRGCSQAVVRKSSFPIATIDGTRLNKSFGHDSMKFDAPLPSLMRRKAFKDWSMSAL